MCRGIGYVWMCRGIGSMHQVRNCVTAVVIVPLSGTRNGVHVFIRVDT